MERPLAMTTERPACGLASLLSMSCRDRAEAFARSLQVRLQTLGLRHGPEQPSPASVPPPSPPPATVPPPSPPPSPRGSSRDADHGNGSAERRAWASTRPPLRLGSSSDSDLFYDFDMEPESPGSPAEEDVLEVVVAQQPLPCALEPESGCTSSHFGTSPGSDSSDSFGPEAFVSPSTSPGWSGAQAPRRRSPPVVYAFNGQTSPPRKKGTVHLNGTTQGLHEEDAAAERSKSTSLENGALGEDDLIRLENGCSIGAVQIPNGNTHYALTTYRSNGINSGESSKHSRTHCDAQETNKTKKLADFLSSFNYLHSTDNSPIHSNSSPGKHMNDGRNNKDICCETVTLNINNEDEIDLLPSEETCNDICSSGDITNENELSLSNSDNWDERFSDYTPGETSSERQEEIKEIDMNSRNIPLSNLENSSNRSVFCRSENLTLERPTIADNNTSNEEVQSALAEMGILPRRSSWEINSDDALRKNTVIINQEDNLTDDVQEHNPYGEKWKMTEDDDNECTSSPCRTASPIICDPASKETSEEKTEILLHSRAKSRDQEENDEDEDSSRQRLRRCSSLKTGKTPPGTPGIKKIVRFADVLGLDLADVRTFLDEIPKIPSSAYDDLRDADLSLGSFANPVVANPFCVDASSDPEIPISFSLIKPCKTLMPMFQQPGGLPDFMDRIRCKFVCLENAVVKDPAMFSIAGVVRVRNLDYHKSVYIRYSVDNWATYSDLQATYISNSCDGFSDKFSFILFAHTLSVGQRLEFAIRYQSGGSQYWDSNGGANYAFQCLPASSPNPYLPLPSPEDRWGSFY